MKSELTQLAFGDLNFYNFNQLTHDDDDTGFMLISIAVLTGVKI